MKLLFLLQLSALVTVVDAFYNTHRPLTVPQARAPPIFASIDTADTSSSTSDEDEDDEKKGPRSLYQNWWPVTLSSSLDPSRPNPVELLDQKLVLWKSDSNEWSCLDDQCAHRFAPLSEGRVVNSTTNKKCLQCAYHGWEFEGKGACARIPQQPPQATVSNRIGVQNYPIRQAAGMVWVWADPSTPELADSLPLPISSLMERFDGIGGTARGFMRDLPYGYEYLGENLVDISHLPFSHHSVGALNREDGRPVPLQMLAESQKEQIAEKQLAGDVLPLFQAQVADAAQHDPEVVAALKRDPVLQARSDPEVAVSTVGFFDPCHVRYHRNPGVVGSSYEIQLFLCPTSAGSSRVFLFAPFEFMLPPVKEAGSSKEEKQEGNGDCVPEKKTGLLQRITAGLNKIKQKGAAIKIGPGASASAKVAPYLGHMMAHSIFDGDGIFLHKQGDRMRRAELTYREYQTPTSSDAMVNAFRRWLDSAAAVTRKVGGERAAKAVTGGDIASEANYYDNRPRADMLDRYSTHTKNCKICSAALEEFQKKRDRLRLATTALVGACGASGFLTASSALLLVVSILKALLRPPSTTSVIVARAGLPLFARAGLPVMLSSALATLGAILGAKRAIEEREKVEKEIHRFYFEDYVHAEKD